MLDEVAGVLSHGSTVGASIPGNGAGVQTFRFHAYVRSVSARIRLGPGPPSGPQALHVSAGSMPRDGMMMSFPPCQDGKVGNRWYSRIIGT